MYQPKIKKDLVMMLSELKEATGKPMTTLIDELLRPQVTSLYETTLKVTLSRQLDLFPVAESCPPIVEVAYPSKRVVEVVYPSKQVMASSPSEVFRLCKDMRSLQQERLDVLTLNTKNHVTMRKTVFLGALNASIVHPREIYAIAIEQRAASIVIVHNHPSGDTQPSKEDIQATQEVKRSGDIIKIPLLDHLIIGEGFYSFKQEGLI